MTDVGNFPAIAALVIFCLAIVLTLLLVFKAMTLRIPLRGRKPLLISVKYYAAPVAAVLAMLACTSMSVGDVGRGLLGNDQIKPYGILILFMSMAYIAGSLDASGIFAWLALKFTAMSGGRGRVLFLFYFLLSSFITTFTSNDVCILTLTPIVCYFAKATRVDPMPFLFAEYAAANTFGALLYTGNPTNIIVADAYDMTFLGYSKYMTLPTFAAGFMCFAMLLLEFYRDIPVAIPLPSVDASHLLRDKLGAAFGSVNMLTCLGLLAGAPSLGWEMWAITLVCAGINVVYNVWAFRSSLLQVPLAECWTCGGQTVDEVEEEEDAGGGVRGASDVSSCGAQGSGAVVALDAVGRVSQREVSGGGGAKAAAVGARLSKDSGPKVVQDGLLRDKASLQGYGCGTNAGGPGAADDAPARVALTARSSGGADGSSGATQSDSSGCSGCSCSDGYSSRVGVAAAAAADNSRAAEPGGDGGGGGGVCDGAVGSVKGAARSSAPRPAVILRAGPVAEAVDGSAAGLQVLPITSLTLAPERGTAPPPALAAPGAEACAAHVVSDLPGGPEEEPVMTVDSLRGKAPTFWALFFDLPWEVVPFALGMFVLVEGLHVQGWLSVFGDGLGEASQKLPAAIFIMGFLSVALANTINNQPMTILLTRVALDPKYTAYVGHGNTHKAALFSLVLGSNIGAVFTIIGALAGILWSNIMGIHGVKITYARFARVCCPVGFVTLVASLLVLWFEFAVFPHDD